MDKWKKARAVLVTYLDDLLTLGAGGCFVAGAWEAWGRPAGLAVAGACLLGYALVVARAKGGVRP